MIFNRDTIDGGSALASLTPYAEWVFRNGQVTEWHSADITQPTQAEIDAEVIRLQTEYDSQAYARSRKAKYDALNQLELISDDSINGTTTHKDAIIAIKAEFPKP
jgi:hypothetical protein